MPVVFGNVNGGFHCPVVGGAFMKDAGIGVSCDGTGGIYGCQIRVAGQGMFNPSGKFLDGRHFIFKGNGSFPDIGSINVKQFFASSGRTMRIEKEDEFVIPITKPP